VVNFDLKVEKVKNFQRNYLESEKFFSKFSYFLEGKFPKPKSDFVFKKVSESKNKTKTNNLINLE
jgi:hypothetical protein